MAELTEFVSKNAIYVSLGILLIEWFLGSTALVKPNSIIESILKFVLKIKMFLPAKK